MANHKIERLSLCFIWTRTFFSLFQDQAAAHYPYGFFARSAAYKAKFEELRSVVDPGEGLSLPWMKTCAHSFWKHYFRDTHLWDVKPGIARDNYLVPFRKRVKPQHILTPWLMTKRAVTLEGFFYRHGVAAVITVRVSDCASLNEAVKRALQARHSGSYEVKWGDGSEGSYSLSALAEYLLDSFCEDALGPDGEKGKGFSPFSIATVIQGGSEYRDQPVKQGDEIHKALEALTTWTESWPSANPPKLEDKRFLPIRHPQDNHYLYGDRQGRAVWFPKLFTPPEDGSKRYALGWYSRNLLLASLQTASLGAFLKHTAERWKTGADIPNSQKHWARAAIKALDGFSQGQNTYRTWSTRVQIEQNGFLDAMNYLKTKL